MDNLLQSDLFFFISSMAVIVFTGFLAAILIYFLSILKDVKQISRILRRESEDLHAKVRDLMAVVERFFNRRRRIKVSRH